MLPEFQAFEEKTIKAHVIQEAKTVKFLRQYHTRKGYKR